MVNLRAISKSGFVVAQHCSRRLWLESNLPGERLDTSTRAIVWGNRVGELARRQRLGGVLIEHSDDFERALQDTQEVLARPGDLIIFEAAFSVDGGAVRCDILERRKDRYYLTEVKSSTGIKDHYPIDLAFQVWVLRRAGLDVARAEMQLLDNTFVYQGDGNYSGIFKTEDLADDIEELAAKIELTLRGYQTVVAGSEPMMARGGHCKNPWPCAYQDRCSVGEPEYPISLLGIRRKAFLDLVAAQGWKDIRDIPDGHIKGDLPARIWSVTRAGEAKLTPEAAEEIARLPFPRFYFDFETYAPAIPIWRGTRPWQQVPFQWSCHVQHADGSIEHKEFLDTTSEFPAHCLAEAMLDALGEMGSIFTYTSFEKTTIKTLIDLCPELRAPLEAIVERLIDLHPLTKASYYHPQMKASWSIKAVLPTMAPDLDYSNLGEVKEGDGAVAAYEEIIDPNTATARKALLVNDLKRYCQRDTEAMVALVRFLVAE